MSMQSKFMMAGSTVDIFRLNEDTVLDVLPPKIYAVRYAQLRGYYLEILKDKLELPDKIYGKAMDRVDKCIATYTDRTKSTGILLTGDKGTGKTLTMSLLANAVIDRLKLPVLIIADPFNGAEFTSFVESIGECCMVFDEFGKMYSVNSHNENEVPQKSLLSLLDGVDKTKRMIILTENRELDINEFMLNRPSRIYYHFRYKKLDEDSIVGYCIDANVHAKVVQEIIELSRKTRIFSFDMLQAIVEEHIRFDSPISEVTEELNIDTSTVAGKTIEVLQVFETVTKVKREVFGTPFIETPANYTYIKIKSVGSSDSKKAVGADAFSSNPVDLVDENDDGNFQDVCIELSDLVYELNGKAVYETREFTIVTKDVPMPKNSYFQYLA